MDFGETITEIQRRGDVGDISCHVSLNALIVLYKVSFLWFNLHTHIKSVLGSYYTQHYLYVVDIIRILGEAAQLGVKIAVQRFFEP